MMKWREWGGGEGEGEGTVQHSNFQQVSQLECFEGEKQGLTLP